MKKLKIFKVTGEIRKPNLKTQFTNEVAAEKPEHAVERVYAEIGSKHRVKRFHITITGVEEVPPDKIENAILRRLVEGDKVGGNEQK